MTIRKCTPYINFGGDASTAIEFYQATLGATIVERMFYGSESPFGPEAAELTMHCHLAIGDAQLMLSDIPPGQSPTRGGDVHVSLEFDDDEHVARVFEGLAEGGEVTMALHDAFWGSKFAMLNDKFGVGWLLSGPRKAR